MNEWKGYKYIKRGTDEGILLEIWQEVGNNIDSTKPNEWKLIHSEIQKEKKWNSPPLDHKP